METKIDSRHIHATLFSLAFCGASLAIGETLTDAENHKLFNTLTEKLGSEFHTLATKAKQEGIFDDCPAAQAAVQKTHNQLMVLFLNGFAN